MGTSDWDEWGWTNGDGDKWGRDGDKWGRTFFGTNGDGTNGDVHF